MRRLERIANPEFESVDRLEVKRIGSGGYGVRAGCWSGCSAHLQLTSEGRLDTVVRCPACEDIRS